MGDQIICVHQGTARHLRSLPPSESTGERSPSAESFHSLFRSLIAHPAQSGPARRAVIAQSKSPDLPGTDSQSAHITEGFPSIAQKFPTSEAVVTCIG